MITTAKSVSVVEFLRTIHRPGEVREIRILNCPDRKGSAFISTASGYYSDIEAAAVAAEKWDRELEPPGTYVTLNPTKTDLLARSPNKMTFKAKVTTQDSDIVHRDWLLIDIDPVRPSGVSASESENCAALELANRIQTELSAEGWPEMVFGMSGNGAYLLAHISLPNDGKGGPAETLVKQVLHGLADRFDTDAAKIDTSTFNAARIAKVFGTTARKGGHLVGITDIEDRPHRKAWFVPPTGELVVVDESLLRAVAKPEATKSVTITPHSSNGSPRTSAFDRWKKYAATLPDAIQGQNGSGPFLTAACECWRFGLSREEATAGMRWFSETKSQPPWSDAEIEHKLADALEKVNREGQFGRRLQAQQNGRPSAKGVAVHIAGQIHVRPEVHLPSGGVEIRETAVALGELLAASDRFFIRGGSVVRLASDEGEPVLWTVKPSELCSDFETVANLKIWKGTKDEPESVNSRCSKATAELILESQAFRNALPEIKVVSRCPVLIERDGQLVQVCGYDRSSGIWAVGSPVPEIKVDEAKLLIDELLQDFNFATAGDAARARAALITPALVMSGLLGGRAPVDLAEADSSQSGKGYRGRLTAAIYGVTIRSVTQKQRGGVGSLQESFDRALERGASFICIDNVRGKVDLPALESFLTEPVYLARTPYGRGVEIDATRIVTMLTSNRADFTIDLANRSSCTRILKQPDDYQFARYPEGDIFDRVSANRSRYLAAVFSVIREWHRCGKPESHVTGHDFRKWARTLGFIVQEILGTAPLLEGHRAAQQRMASPSLNWLRDVALAVRDAKQLGMALRAHQVLTIAISAGVETPGVASEAGLEDDVAWNKASRAVGRQLAKCFQGDSIAIDAFTVVRQKLPDKDGREITQYAFSSSSPNAPESPPNQNAGFPNPPNQCGSVSAPEISSYSNTSAPIRGFGGSGNPQSGLWGEV